MPSAATTAAEIANLALSYAGHGLDLDNLNEDTNEARAALRCYGPARDELLERYQWKFATKRATLAILANEERDGWGFVYALPADCLVPRYIWSGVRNPNADEKVPFDVEATDTGACLLTDAEDAVLVYTARIEEVSRFTPGFVKALAWAIAVELCLVLPIDAKKALAIENKATRARLEALAAQGNTQKDRVAESEYITGRE